MILKRIHIKNFRSIREVAVDVGHEMAIVGGNGTGKSSVLRAIEKFYGQSATLELDDFFGRQVEQPIEIALTFTDLNETERETFASRYHDGEMTVVRVFEAGGGKGNGRYYGATLQHPAFAAVRNADGATAQRSAYNDLKSRGGSYSSLPSVSRADQIPTALAEWEQNNSEKLELARDDGQFFGFTNVAKGALQKATSFVFIPAVRDASGDAVDSRGAVIAKLLELVVRNAIQQRREIREFQAEISTKYRSLTDPEKLHELGSLSAGLTETLQAYYREAAVLLRWKDVEDFEIPLPAADVLLDDDGFEGPVDRKGHGLQRAFILTLLQHLAKATSADAEKKSLEEPESVESQQISDTEYSKPYILPGLILAIEEPELYQHPTKQRHFAKVLRQLSSGELPGVATQTQVLFATHSSLFINLDGFENVRLARRYRAFGAKHKECRLFYSQLDPIVRRLEYSREKPEGTFSVEALKPRLHIVGAEIAEGFFADFVVLVEGASDKAALIAAAAIDGIDLEALGIAILPVGGKGNLDRPAAIFQALQIPTFVLWDCDKQESGTVNGVEHNRALQRLLGVEPAVVADAVTRITDTFACFETKLESILKSEIGVDLYQKELAAVKDKYGVDNKQEAEKIPSVMRELLASAFSRGNKSTSLSMIIKKIANLRAKIEDCDDGEDLRGDQE